VIEHMHAEGKNPGEKEAGAGVAREPMTKHISGLGRHNSVPAGAKTDESSA
ncbi:ribonuclease BN, partial [Pseudomonas sp. MH10]|nr:ribonuclease BN [Pseudomonas sp. MH10]